MHFNLKYSIIIIVLTTNFYSAKDLLSDGNRGKWSRSPFVAVNLCNVIPKPISLPSLKMSLTSMSHSTHNEICTVWCQCKRSSRVPNQWCCFENFSISHNWLLKTNKYEYLCKTQHAKLLLYGPET